MSDQKITQLTDAGTIADVDIVPIVKDPAGTPLNRKGAFSLVKSTLKTYFDTLYQEVGTYLTSGSTNTLTNKRITKRVGTEASSATSTPTADTVDMWTITALALANAIASPSGTPIVGQELLIRIKDNGTARALTFNAIYRFSSDLVAPTTTIINKTLYMKFIYNGADAKWDCLAWLNNF